MKTFSEISIKMVDVRMKQHTKIAENLCSKFVVQCHYTVNDIIKLIY